MKTIVTDYDIALETLNNLRLDLNRMQAQAYKRGDHETGSDIYKSELTAMFLYHKLEWLAQFVVGAPQYSRSVIPATKEAIGEALDGFLADVGITEPKATQ